MLSLMLSACGEDTSPKDYLKFAGGGLVFNYRYSQASLIVIAQQKSPLPEGSIVEADNWIDKLDEKLNLWATQPMMGRARDELAEGIRKINLEVPIIFLSAKTLKEDRIKGLKIGADDYLVKPFSIEELILKIEIFLKRSNKISIVQNKFYTLGKYQFDSNNFVVFNDSEKINLTQRESDLLKLFIENKNVVLKREEILKSLWGTDDYFLGRSLDVFISRLRKILSTEKTIAIENLHGIGFRFSIEQ